MMEKNISNNMCEKLKKSFAWIFNGSRLLQTTCTSTIHFSISCSSCSRSIMMPLQKLRKEKKKKKKKKKIKEDTACGGGGGGGGGEGRTCPPSSPASLPPSKKKKKKKKKKKLLLLSNGYGFTSSSSSDDDDDDDDDDEGELGDIFSSEENDDNIWKEESETLLSSKSFSSDSSEFYQRPSTIASKKMKNIKRQQRVMRKERLEENGFAVVKRSEDPYGDFRSSMVEMIVEKQIMFSGKELEKLLQSYLSLNSYHHHPVIVRAFSDIWEALFVD